jgi:proteasome beta subunit
MNNEGYYKGTTTVGIVCSNGVVLATEKRATMGNLIASRDTKKIYRIADRMALTTAGSVGDAQRIARLASVELKLYELQRKAPMSIKAVSTLISNILWESRYFPYLIQLIIGGVDWSGPKIFSLDPIGGLLEEKKIVATGSGSPVAYGVLEDRYDDEMSVENGVDLAVRALRAAMKRDSASGDGIDIVRITQEGYFEEFREI